MRRNKALLWSWFALMGSACASLPRATPEDVAHARQQGSGTSLARLEAGRAAYVEHCSGCHALHLPKEKPPDEWPSLVDEMEAKARIQPADVELIKEYLVTLSAR